MVENGMKCKQRNYYHFLSKCWYFVWFQVMVSKGLEANLGLLMEPLLLFHLLPLLSKLCIWKLSVLQHIKSSKLKFYIWPRSRAYKCPPSICEVTMKKIWSKPYYLFRFKYDPYSFSHKSIHTANPAVNWT